MKEKKEEIGLAVLHDSFLGVNLLSREGYSQTHVPE
jgi:hypothetical protein